MARQKNLMDQIDDAITRKEMAKSKKKKKKGRSKLPVVVGAIAGGVGTIAAGATPFLVMGAFAGGAAVKGVQERKKVSKSLKKTFSKKNIERERKELKKVTSTSPGRETLPLVGGLVATGASLAVLGPGAAFGAAALVSNVAGFGGFLGLRKKPKKKKK